MKPIFIELEICSLIYFKNLLFTYKNIYARLTVQKRPNNTYFIKWFNECMHVWYNDQ